MQLFLVQSIQYHRILFGGFWAVKHQILDVSNCTSVFYDLSILSRGKKNQTKTNNPVAEVVKPQAIYIAGKQSHRHT